MRARISGLVVWAWAARASPTDTTTREAGDFIGFSFCFAAGLHAKAVEVSHDYHALVQCRGRNRSKASCERHEASRGRRLNYGLDLAVNPSVQVRPTTSVL